MLSLGRLDDKGNRIRRVPQSKTEILISSERYVATRETGSLVVAKKKKGKKSSCHRAWTELVYRRDPPLPERIERLELLKATANVGTGEGKAGNTHECSQGVCWFPR